MRTATMTFTFTEPEWQALRKAAILEGKQPTHGEVINMVKVLALRQAMEEEQVEKDLETMANL